MDIKTELRTYWRNKKFIRQNVMVWFVIYLIFCLIQFSMGRNGDLSTIELYKILTIATIMMMVIFYVNFFLCVFFFIKERLKYVLLSILFLCIFIAFIYLRENHRKDSNRPDIFFLMFLSSVYYILLASIATLYWFVRERSINKKENREMQLQLENTNQKLHQENLLLQNQLLATDIKFLRAQINPHFLFNCLNFFYSEMLEVQPIVAEGVITLSQIMRYSLQDFSKAGGMANLEEELEHINNIIKIHQMRFNNSLHVKLNVECNAKNIQVAPMVLITLVENVFKHGNLADENMQAMINCKIEEDKRIIHFSTINKKKQGTPSVSTDSGMGLANIRQRMEQLYKNNFSLKVSDEINIFKVELIFPFQNKSELSENILQPSNFSA